MTIKSTIIIQIILRVNSYLIVNGVPDFFNSILNYLSDIIFIPQHFVQFFVENLKGKNSNIENSEYTKVSSAQFITLK